MHSSNSVPLSFPVLRTNDYGRFVIKRHMRNHNALVKTALVHVDDRLGEHANKNRELMRAAERFKDSVHIMEKRQRDDRVLSELIHHARPSCDTSVSEHVLRYRTLREARPTWQPGWLERTEMQLSKSTHERGIRHAQSQIDTSAPGAAMHFRKVLNDSRYTKGGVMRRVKKCRRRGGAKSAMSAPMFDDGNSPRSASTVPRVKKKSGRGHADYKQLKPHKVDSVHLAPDNLPDIVKDSNGNARRRGRRGSVSQYDHCAPPAELRAQHLMKSGQAKPDSLSIRKRRKSVCAREVVVIDNKPQKTKSTSPARRGSETLIPLLPNIDPSTVRMEAEGLEFTHKEWTKVRDWLWQTGEEYFGIPGDCRGELLSVAHAMNGAQQQFEGTAQEICRKGSEQLLPPALQFLHKQPVRVDHPVSAQIAALNQKGFEPALIMHLQKLRQYGSSLSRPELPQLKDSDVLPIVNHLFATASAVRRAGLHLNPSEDDSEFEEEGVDAQIEHLDESVKKEQQMDEQVAQLDATLAVPVSSAVDEEPEDDQYESFEEETVESQAAASDSQADETFEREPVESQPVLQPFEPTTPRAPGAEEVEPAAEEAAAEPAAEAAVEEAAAEPAAQDEVAAEPVAEDDEEEEYEDEFEEGEESMSQPAAEGK